MHQNLVQAGKRLALTHYQEQARIATLERERDELAEALGKAQDLRPQLLIDLHYVPECVLMFCNQARAALSKVSA